MKRKHLFVTNTRKHLIFHTDSVIQLTSDPQICKLKQRSALIRQRLDSLSCEIEHQQSKMKDIYKKMKWQSRGKEEEKPIKLSSELDDKAPVQRKPGSAKAA